MFFGSVDAFIQLICCRTRNVYKSFDVFTTFSVSTDDGSEIFGLPNIFNRFFFNVFDINKFYFPSYFPSNCLFLRFVLRRIFCSLRLIVSNFV